jgi:hypothetical protein
MSGARRTGTVSARSQADIAMDDDMSSGWSYWHLEKGKAWLNLEKAVIAAGLSL